MNHPFIFTFILAFACTISNAFSQGCSDAGFCTVGAFRPSIEKDSVSALQNQLKIGSFYGLADHDIAVYGGYVSYQRILSENYSATLKITSLGQYGNEISVYGFSDIFLTANAHVNERIKLTAGAKIPSNNANKTWNAMALPMDYQSSLGTFDAIVGLAYQLNALHLTIAAQIPITQNQNKFLASAYPATSPLSQFQSTQNYQRKADVLLRVSYPITRNKVTLTPSLLPIYHLGEDAYTTEEGALASISGSDGLTLNGNVYLDYQLTATSKLQASAAVPFIVRSARPDGLTRSFIATVEYSVRF